MIWFRFAGIVHLKDIGWFNMLRSLWYFVVKEVDNFLALPFDEQISQLLKFCFLYFVAFAIVTQLNIMSNQKKIDGIIARSGCSQIRLSGY